MTRVMCSGKPVYNRRGYKGLKKTGRVVRIVTPRTKAMLDA